MGGRNVRRVKIATLSPRKRGDKGGGSRSVNYFAMRSSPEFATLAFCCATQS